MQYVSCVLIINGRIRFKNNFQQARIKCAEPVIELHAMTV